MSVCATSKRKRKGEGKKEVREERRKGTYLREKIKPSQTFQNITPFLLIFHLGGMIDEPPDVPCLCMHVT